MVNTRIGAWIATLISSRREAVRAADREELLASWPGDSAEPFTVLWYVMLELVEENGADHWEPQRLSSFCSYLAEHFGHVPGLDEGVIGNVMRVATGDRAAEIPDAPVEALVHLCIGACVVLARHRGVSDEQLEQMVSQAERAAIAQGYQIP